MQKLLVAGKLLRRLLPAVFETVSSNCAHRNVNCTLAPTPQLRSLYFVLAKAVTSNLAEEKAELAARRLRRRSVMRDTVSQRAFARTGAAPFLFLIVNITGGREKDLPV